uniref:Myosin motor domain-containing protein n=1 Tax=Arcella intermedia TaxID=1963864 RepID=A0A6B2LCI5_9EUKA
MGKLIETLSSSERHYVRCIKPNELRSPSVFDSFKVLNQLSCNGVFETVTLRKAGFSIRLPSDRFIEKYWPLLSSHSLNGIEKLLPEALPDKKEWALGTSKVFLRDKAINILNEKLVKLWQARAIVLQASIRRYNAHQKYLKLWSIQKIQSFIKSYNATRKLEGLIELNKNALVIQNHLRQYRALLVFRVIQMENEKAVVLQGKVRRWNAQMVYMKLVREYKAACLMQSVIRRMKARSDLEERRIERERLRELERQRIEKEKREREERERREKEEKGRWWS